MALNPIHSNDTLTSHYPFGKYASFCIAPWPHPPYLYKNTAISQSFGSGDCGMPERIWRYIPNVFFLSSPLFFVSPHTLRFQPADGGRVLLKIAEQHSKQRYVLAKRGFKKWRAITLQLNAFCLDLWLLIELRPTTAGPFREDSIQPLRAKNTPRLLESSHWKYLILTSWVRWLKLNDYLSVCLVWLCTTRC